MATATAKIGDTVLVNYTGKLDDGSVFDTSQQRGPLRINLGETRLIPGFQNAVVGMQPGETKTATIPPDEAYGPRRDEMVLDIDRGKLPAEIDPHVGQDLQLQTQTGQPVPAKVVEVSEEAIKVDANHPLAGQELTFDIELVEIVPGA
jgi:FKBP-type peptidyl-prolyl cis-trans isomerase 2